MYVHEYIQNSESESKTNKSENTNAQEGTVFSVNNPS